MAHRVAPFAEQCPPTLDRLLKRLPGFGPRRGNGYVLMEGTWWRCGSCGHVMPDTYDSDCDKCHSDNVSIIGEDT